MLHGSKVTRLLLFCVVYVICL